MDDTRATTGTTGPIFIPRTGGSEAIYPGKSYFAVKIHSAQAVYSGYVWERIRSLIITSQVTLNHPLLGAGPLRTIQRSRQIHRNRAEQLGLCTNLIKLVPATMDHISISIDFVLDKENRLVTLRGLINDDAFFTAVSLSPGAVAVARTIGTISQKLLQAFLEPNALQPILQFSGDFNISSNELKDGYYAILGTTNEHSPLPRPLPDLQIASGELLADGEPVTEWSYVVLDVHNIKFRTRELNDGALWESKLREAEALADQVANDPFVNSQQRQQCWKACVDCIKESQVGLLQSHDYLRSEVQNIVKTVYHYCYTQIFGEEVAKAPEAFRGESAESYDQKGDRIILNIPLDEDLKTTVDEYNAQALKSLQLARDAKLN